MKIIIVNGKELPVDDSSLTDDDSRQVVQQVTMVDEGVHLKKVWIATCEKNNRAFLS